MAANQYDLIAEQDKQRTVRSFIGVLAGAFGVDQSYANADANSYNTPYGYQAIGQGGKTRPFCKLLIGWPCTP